MNGRTAFVTGGSRGIGRSTALALGRDGNRVAVGYARDRDSAEKVCAEIAEAGGDARPVQLDVTDRAAVDAAFESIEQAWGGVEILVNNAGITRDGLLVRMSDAQWDDVLRTDLDGVFRACRRATTVMMRARFGRVVNVSSVAALSGAAGQANYAAAKAGLVGLTRAMARELASREITCNVVLPGPIETDMTAALPGDRRDELSGEVPLGRFGRADEVAAAIAFLCSDAASYVTGAVLAVDGGLGMGH